MAFRLSQCALVSALLLASCLALAEESETRSFSLPNHGSLELKVPRSWQSKVSQPPDNLPPTIVFAPPGAPSFQVLLTPLWAARPDIALPGPGELRRDVERAAQRVKSHSVEKELPIKALKGPSAAGYYFTATDKAPEPGDYKYMTQGMFRLGDLLITFTTLTNDDSKRVNEETLAILEQAARTGGHPTSADGTSPVREDAIQISQRASDYLLTVPVSRLVMSVPRGGLSPKHNAVGGSTDNPRYFYFQDSASHLIVSGWFEPEQEFAGVKKLWEEDTRAWKKNGLPDPRDVAFTRIGNWDAVVYDLDVPTGTNSHIRAHWIQAGTWIDVHLSITSGQSSQQARAKLESVLRSIAVTEKK